MRERARGLGSNSQIYPSVHNMVGVQSGISSCGLQTNFKITTVSAQTVRGLLRVSSPLQTEALIGSYFLLQPHFINVPGF